MMNPLPRYIWVRYGIAILSVMLFSLFEKVMHPFAGRDAILLVSLIPIIVSAWAAISLLTVVREGARAALQEADRRSADALRDWQYVFEHAGWGIVVIGPVGLSVRAVNAAYARMHGYTVEELTGRPLILTLAPESRIKLERNIQIADENGHHIYESLHVRKDGTTFPALIDFTSLKDEQGNLLLGAAYCQDITDRKELEERVRETQKLESLGVLAGGLAHDFNNLLTGILGNASLAFEMQPADSPAHSYIAEVMRSSEKAADLTRQMLAYAGKGRFILRPVNLSDEVRDLREFLRVSIPKKVRLEFDLSSDIPMVDADPSQIQQLIFNLVVNGAEAIGEQYGTVRVKTHTEVIDEAPDLQPGTYACLEVSDTGSGMDENTIARIFDPFFTTKFTGRGLGLAAVSGIVRSHRGSLNVQSKLGEGSTFRVLLPEADSEYAGAMVPVRREKTGAVS
jgi:PAS domain S-box-containing protein